MSSGASPSNYQKTPAAGSEAVLHGMMLLALMVILVVGGYAIFFRRPTLPPPPAAPDPQFLVSLIVQPLAPFPGTFSWGTLCAWPMSCPASPAGRRGYQAARNLAYLGSNAVPWDVYRELLSEQRQFCNFRARLPDGRLVIEESAARQVILGALKDLAAWHTKHARIAPDQRLLAVYSSVDLLAQSPIIELKSQAEKTQAVLFR